jgi:hypothetical protein
VTNKITPTVGYDRESLIGKRKKANLKGMNYGTTIERNVPIDGHKAY